MRFLKKRRQEKTETGINAAGKGTSRVKGR